MFDFVLEIVFHTQFHPANFKKIIICFYRNYNLDMVYCKRKKDGLVIKKVLRIILICYGKVLHVSLLFCLLLLGSSPSDQTHYQPPKQGMEESIGCQAVRVQPELV